MIELFDAGVMALLAGSTLIEIAPVKLNPLSWIARMVGRAINAEVIEKVNSIEKEVKGIKRKTDEHAAVACRIRILHFGDELRHDVHHTKEHFDQILDDITEYDQYCADHPEFENGKTVATTSYIKSTYAECLKENDFL